MRGDLFQTASLRKPKTNFRLLYLLSIGLFFDMKDRKYIFVAIEGGGTSFRLAVCQLASDAAASGEPTILARTEIDSSHDNPQKTLLDCVDFLLTHKPHSGYDSLGLATFGPVGVLPHKEETYGRILPTTPKPAWKGVDLLTPLQKACQGEAPLAIKIETDVNAPALAEYMEEVARRPAISTVSYVTIGTGVGVGLVVNGKCVHGRMHPEGGHIAVQALPNDNFQGYSWGVDNCPYHGRHTVEGLASSVALTERLEQLTKQKTANRSVLKDLPDDHEIWQHAENAVANLCVSLLLTLSMEKIVLGGGLMKRTVLLEKIRKRTVDLLNGYLGEFSESHLSSLITLSQHGDDAGLNGAIVLAKQALQQQQDSAQKETEEKKTKQLAFSHGLWHGFLVGAVTMAVAVKYFLAPRHRR